VTPLPLPLAKTRQVRGLHGGCMAAQTPHGTAPLSDALPRLRRFPALLT